MLFEITEALYGELHELLISRTYLKCKMLNTAMLLMAGLQLLVSV